MLFDIFAYVGTIGAPALAIYSVYRRIKKKDKNTAGYVFNGKTWVAWLLMFCIISILFMVFGMPLMGGGTGYHPAWGFLWMMLLAIILYISYVIISFVPATAEEIQENKETGNTVLGDVGTAATSMFAIIIAAIWGTLVSLPGMIKNALNPVLAVKKIGNTMYKVVGVGFEHVIGGIIALFLLAVLVFAIIYIAALFFTIIGTIALGIIAIVKFVINNRDIFKTKEVEIKE